MSDLAAWDRLTALLTDDPRVAPQVRLALQDPDGYLGAHAGVLADRGITTPDEVEGVLALTDALEQVGEVAIADWAEEPGEVVAMLRRLPRVRATRIALGAGAGHDVERAVVAANALLAPAAVAIVQLDEGNDSYSLVAVPADRVRAVVAAGAVAGVDVVTFG